MSNKEKLLARIKDVQDKAVPEELLAQLNLKTEPEKEVIKLTPEQKTSIDEGLNDIAAGRTFTDKEVRKMSEEWLRNR